MEGPRLFYPGPPTLVRPWFYLEVCTVRVARAVVLLLDRAATATLTSLRQTHTLLTADCNGVEPLCASYQPSAISLRLLLIARYTVGQYLCNPLSKVVLFAANAPPATPNDMVSANISATTNNVMRLRIWFPLSHPLTYRSASHRNIRSLRPVGTPPLPLPHSKRKPAVLCGE